MRIFIIPDNSFLSRVEVIYYFFVFNLDCIVLKLKVLAYILISVNKLHWAQAQVIEVIFSPYNKNTSGL